ncbi:MAG: DNA primase [Euryarchaeota archaeon]|nr:DNA primase [Euryarchaeota archaeon]
MIPDPTTTKYMIKAQIKADGIIEKPDVVGAIFGQTEGLLGNELDLRDLQKSARIGRIEVDIDAKKGKSEGTIYLPSSLDKVETAILAAALESIDRVGPCKAQINVQLIEDVRTARRKQVIDRAKALLSGIMDSDAADSELLTEEVRAAVQTAEITRWGPDRLPAGPNIGKSDAVIIVEGRNDVLNLLKHGVKNAIAVEGTNVPKSIQDLSREVATTAFVDGDRGGELIVRELLQTAEIDFVARAPQTREVEELPHKLIMKALKNKIPAEQFAEMYGIQYKRPEGSTKDRAFLEKAQSAHDRELDKLAGPDVMREGPEAMQPPSRPPQQVSREERRMEDRRPDQRRDERRDEPRREEPRREERREEEPRRRGLFGRLRGPEGGREERSEAPPPPAKALSGPQSTFKQILDQLQGSLKATLLGAGGVEVQKEIAVRDLAEILRNTKDGVEAVVFDGVITQRLLDIAAEKKIKTVVGAKLGNIQKKPAEVEVFARDDLQ